MRSPGMLRLRARDKTGNGLLAPGRLAGDPHPLGRGGAAAGLRARSRPRRRRRRQDMPETGLRFGGVALGGRAQHSGEGVRGALRLDLEPRRVSGVRRRYPPPRFLDLLAVIRVVGVALAVDLVTDHLGLCAAEHHQGGEAACEETQALMHRRTSPCLAVTGWRSSILEVGSAIYSAAASHALRRRAAQALT